VSRYRRWHSDEHEAEIREAQARGFAGQPEFEAIAWSVAYNYWRNAVSRAMADPGAPMDELIARASVAAEHAGLWPRDVAAARLRRIVAGEEPDPC
jgi:hypothetical protein